MMGINEVCPYCKNLLEPVCLIYDYGMNQGLLRCSNCSRQTFIFEIEDSVIYEYPFEGSWTN